ncbi:hypothetical protein BSK60_32510 [Paenibacillus odorifer]|nr:hypothetical protein BSK60_32510 [Paenibacillus odorifer]
MFYRLQTKEIAVPLFRTYKCIVPAKTNLVMRTIQTKRWYDDIASFAQEIEMSNLSWLIVSITNDTLFGLTNGIYTV